MTDQWREPTQQEIDWFSSLGVFKLDEIYEVLNKALNVDGNNRGRCGDLRCFAVAQAMMLAADGFLEYHEGKAIHKIGHTSERHAWNTFHGEIIDLMWPPSMYRDYESEHAYTFAEVKAELSKRNGVWDWLNNPEVPELLKSSKG